MSGDLVPRRCVYGRADSTRFASSSILPCAESSLPTQSLYSASPLSQSSIASSSETLPCSSRVTICSSSRSSSSYEGSVNRRSERTVCDLDVDVRARRGRRHDDAVASADDRVAACKRRARRQGPQAAMRMLERRVFPLERERGCAVETRPRVHEPLPLALE